MTKKRKPLGPLQKLQQIYDWELNARIDWFWDGGFDVALGDDCNGWIDKASFESLSDAIGWLYKRAEQFVTKEERKESAMSDLVSVCVLQCSCGCREHAISINGRRITRNTSGGPWRVLLAQEIDASEITKALSRELAAPETKEEGGAE